MFVEVEIYYLQMQHRDSVVEVRSLLREVGGRLRLVDPDEWTFPRQMYCAVGGPLNWTDRLVWSDEQWQNYAARESLSMYELLIGNQSAGYFELEQGGEGAVQIAYFGLLPEFVGRGLGRVLLTAAVQTAWNLGAKRVWLHTCTLDHRHALPNYESRGFVHYDTRIVTKEMESLPPDSLAAKRLQQQQSSQQQ